MPPLEFWRNICGVPWTTSQACSSRCQSHSDVQHVGRQPVCIALLMERSTCASTAQLYMVLVQSVHGTIICRGPMQLPPQWTGMRSIVALCLGACVYKYTDGTAAAYGLRRGHGVFAAPLRADGSGCG